MARSTLSPYRSPRLAVFLFEDTRSGWIWLILRVWLGWQWLSSGWGKVQNPAWMDGGSALRTFLERAVAVPDTGRPAITFDWYRSFLEFLISTEAYTWFGPFIAIGEVLVGIGLIVGLFTAIAAFFGALMNFNFLLAGTASTNPVLFLVAILIMLAWRVAGWYGLDRWALRWIGTPWQSREEIPPGSTPASAGMG